VTAHAFLGRPVPPGFAVREVVVGPGEKLSYVESEWCDCIVAVESGTVDLASHHGVSATFIPGDILWLSGLPVSSLENRGSDPTVLVAVSRDRSDEFLAAARSNPT
jgi:hypothetical protein